MAFQPAPTYAEVSYSFTDKKTGKTESQFNPVWLNWFLTLAFQVDDNTLTLSAGVFHSTPMTLNEVVLGDGGDSVKPLGAIGTAGDVLTSQGAGLPPQWAAGGSGGAHASLTGLQGGAPTEYYHLDLVDYNALSPTRITKGVDTTDDLIVDSSAKGLVIKDAAGTPHYWRLSVTTAGALVTTDLGTTKP